jgi:hypothetical protein
VCFDAIGGGRLYEFRQHRGQALAQFVGLAGRNART